ncbi:unnamed protein product [Allacma fusca]|uniref:Uncharacterized protein n=1 Tax=Allacma fusca TaxID=39272 RepID=A0A8J2KCB8_9HEXA|nr:unnamed protein product [Allacma fusca]
MTMVLRRQYIGEGRSGEWEVESRNGIVWKGDWKGVDGGTGEWVESVDAHCYELIELVISWRLLAWTRKPANLIRVPKGVPATTQEAGTWIEKCWE